MTTVPAAPPPATTPLALSDPPDPTTLDRVVDALSAYVHRGTDEYQIQASVARVLAAEGLPFQTEVTLSDTDRVDFIAGDGVAVEVKVKGSQITVLRQLQRYARHDRVRAVVLASTRRVLLAGLPTELHGKPLAITLLRGGGL